MTGGQSTSLSSLVTRKLLLRQAGSRSFERGEAAFDQQAVGSLRVTGNCVKAKVRGTHVYQVELRVDDGAMDYACSCPVGQDGDFCKHCVAVGLAWLAKAAGDTSEETEPDLKAYLEGLAKDHLVSLLLEQADENEGLHRMLMVQAARSGTSKGAAGTAWRNALDSAMGNPGYISYREAYGYYTQTAKVVESLGELLVDGYAEDVVGLAEYGLAAIERCLNHADDSDGRIGGLLHDLQALHLEACQQARPDPEQLGERVFRWELGSGFDTFHRAAATYADVLGTAGLAVYRRLAEAEWAKLPALGPGEKDPQYNSARFTVTSIMAELARCTGDLEALVAIMAHDLSSPYSFLQIAEIYQESGQPEAALDWAERGWRAFEGWRRDERLRSFIADAYQSQGRHDEAVALAWDGFIEQPSLPSFKTLKDHAAKGAKEASWRTKALDWIRERIATNDGEANQRNRQGQWVFQDHSLLVEILLDQEDPEAAWQEARDGGCRSGLWLMLAECRAEAHPLDAVEIYQNHIAELLHDTGDPIYQEVIRYLGLIEGLLAAAGQAQRFAPLVARIRDEQRRKRNLMKLLDRKSW